MKLPRDVSGTELATLLRRFGYETTRQTGSHLRLTSTFKGSEPFSGAARAAAAGDPAGTG